MPTVIIVRGHGSETVSKWIVVEEYDLVNQRIVNARRRKDLVILNRMDTYEADRRITIDPAYVSEIYPARVSI